LAAITDATQPAGTTNLSVASAAIPLKPIDGATAFGVYRVGPATAQAPNMGP
jgi:hypothetical protein